MVISRDVREAIVYVRFTIENVVRVTAMDEIIQEESTGKRRIIHEGNLHKAETSITNLGRLFLL